MTMLNTVRKAGSSFDDQLSIELLKIELLRTRILGYVFTFGFALVVVSIFLLGDSSLPIYDSTIGKLIPLGATFVLATMEFGFQFRIKYWLANNMIPPGWWWYTSAANEVLVPTIAMYLIGLEMPNPLDVLHTPISSLYFAFIIMSVLRLRGTHSLFVGTLSTLSYLAVYIALLFNVEGLRVFNTLLHEPVLHIQSAIFIFVAGLLSAFVARQLRTHFESTMRAQEERGEVLKIFGRQTSPAVVEQLIQKKGEPDSKRLHVSVMFVDVRGFTSYAESREPETVVAYLNSLFSFMIDAVHEHGGMVHQLLGDGFMAVFGAPLEDSTHAKGAVQAGLDILSTLGQKQQDGEIPATRIGIGIHSGQALVGMVGSNIHREYKITGDVVNVAARLEELNKTLQTCMLVSASTMEHAEEHCYHQFPIEHKTVIRGRATEEVVHGIPEPTSHTSGS